MDAKLILNTDTNITLTLSGNNLLINCVQDINLIA